MQPGEIVSERFEIELRAGGGGMGEVYRALDRHTGARVAIKVLQATGNRARVRFGREAVVLAGLRHPGIVAYVAHGATPAGQLYLAMEWLEGEDLHQRLRRAGTTTREALTIAERTAEALAAAHARGVIHRDVKPSNVFLVGQRVDEIKILDFGVALFRAMDSTLAQTQVGTSTGALLGTIGYFAPEQARGSRTVDARADVFSLGCVLFKCLTGKLPFRGHDPSAVLAKILFEEAPRVRELRAHVPPALDDLVARMLAKDPARRPASGSEVAAELRALGDSIPDEGEPAPGTNAPSTASGLTTGEKRLVSVVAAAAFDVGLDPDAEGSQPSEVTTEDATDLRETLGANEPLTVPGGGGGAAEGAGAPEPDLDTPSPTANREGDLQASLALLGARLERLADGVVVATIAGGRPATDQAAQAARVALTMRAHWPAVPMALATGRSVLVGRLPVGDAIDRAIRALRQAALGEQTPAPGTPRPIVLDDTTAGLLDARFDVRGGPAGLELHREREVLETARTLLGRETPCVGREPEIAVLGRLYESTVDGPTAQAVLVTGGAGVGKSRLRGELLQRLREGRLADDGGVAPLPEPEVWIARGDPMSAGSPFGLLAQVVRRAAGLLAGEPAATRFQKLRARLGRHLEGLDLDRVAEFLGELAGAPAPPPGSVQLRAARQDPVLMGDQMRRAWEDWLAVECAARPVVLVLEDLQWGDLPTVKFVDAALRNLRELPLLVLAVARPEVHELFPKLWSERRVQEIRLGELTRRACERLVKETLGAEVPDDTVQRLIEQAGGNALYLEELIRAAAEGRTAELPETVIAMVQARLEGLDPEARRILRAASIFGGVFWRGGVVALLGGAEATRDVETWLAILADRELVSRRPESRFPAEEELAFRHEIVREAAFAMLTDEDRALGHRLAGEWLLAAGEDDAALLAQHFERGQEPGRAGGFYARAAADAFEGNDFAAAVERAERALACGAEGEARGALRLVQAEAHGWRGENADSERRAEEAMALLPRGGPSWWAAAAQLCEAAGKLGATERVEALGRELCALGAGESPSVQALVGLARAVPQLLFLGHYELAGALLAEIGHAPRAVADDPAVAGWIARARAIHAMFAGDAGQYLELAVESVLHFDRAGDVRNATRQRNSVGFASIEVGMLAKAERALIDALAGAERMGLHTTAASARQNLGLVRARQGALEEARAILAGALDAHRDQGDLRMQGGARVYLAVVELLAGDLDRAEQEAVQAADVLRVTLPGLSYALAVLAQIRLAKGDADLALLSAQEAMEILEGLGNIEEGESAVRLALAEALWAVGRPGEAREVILAARRRLEERARRMADPVVRLSFLAQVPDNARTVELAEDWASIRA